MQCYDRFVKEITDIRRWFFTTLYSYLKVRDQFSECIKEGESVDAELELAFKESGCNSFSLVRRLSSDNIKMCKELALIRSISALEVFTVDAVREVYSSNKSPFMVNTSIEYNISEILSCENIQTLQDKYINSRCRNLHSGGFLEIQKYYKKIFKINFSEFSHRIGEKDFGITYLTQYHQIRHLIVHRLGNTDEQYRKNYNCPDANVIRLNEEDLSIWFEVILSFAFFIDKKMNKYILTPPAANEVEIKAEILADLAFDYFDPAFPIRIKKNKSIPLSMILKSKEFEEGNIVTVHLQGLFAYMRKYYKTLLKKCSAGELRIISYNVLSLIPSYKNQKQFPWEDVEKVIALLPEKPWEKHIHKRIAEQLGWSNSKVSQIINNILAEQPAKISIEAKTLELKIDGSHTFTLVVEPPELSNKVVWQSSNPSIAEVNNGVVVAISPGTATILARLPGSMYKAFCTVTVSE